MSTRTNIKIIDNLGEILLYKHHDGYQEFMIPFLKEYIEKSMQSADWMATRLIKDTECEPSTCLHGDIEYYYEIDFTTPEIIRAYSYDMNLEKKHFLKDYDKIDLEEVKCLES